MIPIPRAGILKRVCGLEAACEVEGIHEVTMTQNPGAELVPLPEGNRYLGFIFARGNRPQEVEVALRLAHAKLQFEIEANPVGVNRDSSCFVEGVGDEGEHGLSNRSEAQRDPKATDDESGKEQYGGKYPSDTEDRVPLSDLCLLNRNGVSVRAHRA